MKELIDWIKSWPRNKFSLPYIFFFFTYNWPLLVYFYQTKSSKDSTLDLFQSINSYLAAYSPWTFLTPVLLAAAYIVIAPWLNFSIDRVNASPNRMRELEKARSEHELDNLKNEILSLKIEALDKEAEMEEKERQRKSSHPDAQLFSKLNSILPEVELRRIMDQAESDYLDIRAISPSDAETIKTYLRAASSTEYAYENNFIQMSHLDFLAKLNSIAQQLNARSKREGNYVISRNTDFEPLQKAYKKYRRDVRDLLGI